MENASKALLIAGGVLIAILIISLGLYMFNIFAGHSANIYAQMEQNEKSKFNTQFTKYEGQQITIQDVITIMNLARDNNKKYNLESNEENNYYISINVTIEGTSSPNYKSMLENAFNLPLNSTSYESNTKDIIKDFTDKDYMKNYSGDDDSLEKDKPKIWFNCHAVISEKTELVKLINIIEYNNFE